jgi:hypothetical protein
MSATTQLCIAFEAVTQYRFVKVNATAERVENCDAADERAFGVATAAASAAGDEVLVAVEGYTLVDLGGALEAFDEVKTDDDGKAIKAADQNDFIIGYYAPEPVDGAMVDGADNQRGRIYLYGYKGNQVP